jgi:lipoprotein NlpI
MENRREAIELGKTYLKSRNFKRAEEVLQQLLDESPQFADVHNLLGVIYHQTNQFGRAIEQFKSALKLNPQYTEALLNLSVVYNDLGEHHEARDLLKKSGKKLTRNIKTLDPFLKGKLANRHADLGDFYAGLGLWEPAGVEFKKALDLAPNFYDIRVRYAISLREGGIYKAALSELDRIIKEKPNYNEAHIQKGVTLLAQGHKEEARDVWEAYAKKHPNDEAVAVYLKLTGDSKKSTSSLKKSASRPRKES